MPKIFESLSETFVSHVLPLEQFRLFSDMENIVFSEEKKKLLIQCAEKYAEMDYEPILAHSYMRFEKNGNRSIYEAETSKRYRMVWHLFLGEYVERKGRFLEKLIDGIWLILDECTWVIPAHGHIRVNYVPKLPLSYKEKIDIVDLFSAEVGAMLSLILYFGKSFLDEVTPVICDRITYEVKRRVILPYLNYNDFWWMGYTRKNINNWCPWITSNVLVSCALCEEDLDTRKQLTKKAMEILDHFTLMYHDDGGCDEGPNYWTVAGASYFDCLEILYDITGGTANVFDTQFIRNMGEYFAKFCINQNENYFINFADAGPKVKADKHLVSRFGRRTKSEMLETFGSGCNFQKDSVEMKHTLYRALKNHFENTSESEDAVFNYPKKVWFPGIQVMIAREKSDLTGLFFAMKGGHNRESHNHNDVGHFVVYSDGQPLIIDVGVGTYCADTFNANRYKIWTMRSDYHNLPSFNDVVQKNGFEFHSDEVIYDPENNRLQMSLKNAYPKESGIGSYIRIGELKNGAVKITDKIKMCHSSKICFHYIVCDEPAIENNGKIRLANGKSLFYNSCLKAAIECIQIEDKTIISNWNRNCVYRIRLQGDNITEEDFIVTIQ